jgi:hypothetical protein
MSGMLSGNAQKTVDAHDGDEWVIEVVFARTVVQGRAAMAAEHFRSVGRLPTRIQMRLESGGRDSFVPTQDNSLEPLLINPAKDNGSGFSADGSVVFTDVGCYGFMG